MTISEVFEQFEEKMYLFDAEAIEVIKRMLILYAKNKCTEQKEICAKAVMKNDMYYSNVNYEKDILSADFPKFETILKRDEKEIAFTILKKSVEIRTIHGTFLFILVDKDVTNIRVVDNKNQESTLLFNVLGVNMSIPYLLNRYIQYELIGQVDEISDKEIKEIIDYIELHGDKFYRDYIAKTWEITNPRNSFKTLTDSLNVYTSNPFKDTQLMYEDPKRYNDIENNTGKWIVIKKIK